MPAAPFFEEPPREHLAASVGSQTMQGHHPRQTSVIRSLAPWLLLGAALAIVAVVLLWPRERLAVAPEPAAPVVAAAPGYRNRSMRSHAAPPAPADPDSTPMPVPLVAGNVYDMNGSPVVGAAVLATTFEVAGNVPTIVGAAESDVAGRFELALPEGTYQINATMEGYGPTSITAHSGDTMSVVLPWSGLVTGHIRDEARAPVRHFTVDVISVVPGDVPAPPPVWSRTFDSPDGSFHIDQLPTWGVVVRATAEGYAPAFSSQLVVQAGTTQDIDLPLLRGCVLTGEVTDRGGAPLPGVYIDAETRLVAGSMSEAAMQTANQATTGPDGAFRLEHVPPGPVVVRGYDGSNAVTTTVVDVAACDRLLPVHLVMSPGGAIEGTARREDGTPIAGAWVSLTDRSIGFVNMTTGADGHFRFDTIPAGTMRLELVHGDQVTLLFVPVNEGEVTKQDISLVASGQGELRGRVTVGDSPMSGAQLLVASNRGPEQGIAIYHPVTAKDGSYRVSSLPEGAYLVSVMSTDQGGGAQVRAGEVATFDLHIGAPELQAAPGDE